MNGCVEPQNIASSAQRRWAELNGVLVVLIFLSLFYLSSPKRDHQTSLVDNQISAADNLIEIQKAGASVLCRNHMESLLRAPSTAKFPWLDDYVEHNEIHDGSIMVTVNSYVDAQNGFGAMIRTKYICKVEYHDKNSENGMLFYFTEKK